MLGEILGGLAIGTILGLLGGGGALIAIPVLIYAFHYSFRLAIGSGLVLVVLGVLPALFLYWQRRQIHWLSALIMGAGGMVGARLSSQLGGLVPDTLLLGLLLLLMLISAVNMLKPDQRKVDLDSSKTNAHNVGLIMSGLGIGLLTGLIGVGGGFLLVPALLYLGRLSLRLAIPTSLVIIGLNSLSGITGYWTQLPLGQTGFQWLMMSCLVGSILGYYLNQRLSAQVIKKAFALFLLILMVVLLVFPPH
jgi:uncharacterized membrane protein YfcA